MEGKGWSKKKQMENNKCIEEKNTMNKEAYERHTLRFFEIVI